MGLREAGAVERRAPGFQFRRTDALPPLAWCAEVRRGVHDVVVKHGRFVETTHDAFFEGVWDGLFVDFDFRSSHTTMGSGGCVEGERLCFVAPSHTYESLVTLVDGDRLWVSNSIAFVLASADDAPDLRYPWYHRDLLRLQRRGATGTEPAALPTARGRTVLLHAGTDLIVGDQLAIATRPRPQPPEPRDFTEYRALLADTVAALVRNADDSARTHRFPLITTTSSGYDSPATSVLAAAAGVHKAITFETQEPHAHVDSGRAIAEALGLEVHTIDARAWRGASGCPEIEFLACSSGWAMLPMAPVASGWPGSVVFLGSMGDDVWRRDRQDVKPRLARPHEEEPASAGLREFRLRAGIVFVHVPTIGAIHADAIHRIARSDEMAHWSLGNGYDRPVPRRIVEEAGIPRAAFGHTIYMTIDTQTPEILRRLRRCSFAGFIDTISPAIPRRVGLRLALEWRFGPAAARVALFIARIAWVGGRRLRLRLIQWTGRAVTTRIFRWQWHEMLPILYTFHWGTTELARRYGDAIGRSRTGATGSDRADRLRRPGEPSEA